MRSFGTNLDNVNSNNNNPPSTSTIPGYTGYKPGYYQEIGTSRNSFQTEALPPSKGRANVVRSVAGPMGDSRLHSWRTTNQSFFKGSPWVHPNGASTAGPSPWLWFMELSPAERHEVYQQAYKKVGGMRAVKQIESDIRTKIFERNRGGAYRLRKAFTLFDKDASGDIDIEEFNEALRWFGLQYADEHLIAVLGAYDDDASGALDYEEFVKCVLGEEFVGFASKKKQPEERQTPRTMARNRGENNPSGLVNLSRGDVTMRRVNAELTGHERACLSTLQGTLQNWNPNWRAQEVMDLLCMHGLSNANEQQAERVLDHYKMYSSSTGNPMGSVPLEELTAVWASCKQQGQPCKKAARAPLQRGASPKPPTIPRHAVRARRPTSAETRNAAQAAARCYKLDLNRPLSERTARKPH